MSKIQSPAKIACIQMRISYCRVEENLAEADRLIEAACANGATLLILPETFTTGSAFDTRAEAYAVAEAIPDGRTSQFLLKKAREHGVYITGSFVERDGADLYNTAVLAGPDGLVGKFRKLHPCEDEVYWAEPGNLGIRPDRAADLSGCLLSGVLPHLCTPGRRYYLHDVQRIPRQGKPSASGPLRNDGRCFMYGKCAVQPCFCRLLRCGR